MSLCFRFLAIIAQNPIPTMIASPPTPTPTPIPAFAPVLSKIPVSVSTGTTTTLEDAAGFVVVVVRGDVDVVAVDSGPSDIKVVGV